MDILTPWSDWRSRSPSGWMPYLRFITHRVLCCRPKSSRMVGLSVNREMLWYNYQALGSSSPTIHVLISWRWSDRVPSSRWTKAVILSFSTQPPSSLWLSIQAPWYLSKKPLCCAALYGWYPLAICSTGFPHSQYLDTICSHLSSILAKCANFGLPKIGYWRIFASLVTHYVEA